MEAVLDDGGGGGCIGGCGGGGCGETALGLDSRPEQEEEERMEARAAEEALELVSGAAARLRRRLRVVELKMERAREAAFAQADALRRQVARMERLEGKIAAVESRFLLASDLDDDDEDDDRVEDGCAWPSDDDEYPLCPKTSSNSLISETSRELSLADVAFLISENSRLRSACPPFHAVSDKNDVSPPGRASFSHCCDSSCVSSTAAADFPNPESSRLDFTAQTSPTTSAKHKYFPLVCRLCKHLKHSFASSTAGASHSISEASRLDPTTLDPLTVTDKLVSAPRFSKSLCLIRQLPDSSSGTVDSTSSPITGASRSGLASQVPLTVSDKHASPTRASVSPGLYRVLLSPTALLSRTLASSAASRSQFTPKSDILAGDADERPVQSSEQPLSAISPLSSSPAGDITAKSTDCTHREFLRGLVQNSASTQTDAFLVAEGCDCSSLLPHADVLLSSGYVTPKEEDLPVTESISRRCSSVMCHCSSSAGGHRSVSAFCSPKMISRSTSCATFSNTKAASSSGFYDCEEDSQSSSVSGFGVSQSSSFYPIGERVTQQVVWMSSPYNPSIYYCLPFVNRSFYSVCCNEDLSAVFELPQDPPRSDSRPPYSSHPRDVAVPVSSAASNSSAPSRSRCFSYTPPPPSTPVMPSGGTDCHFGSRVSKSGSESDRSTFPPNVPISFSEPFSCSFFLDVSTPVSTSDNRQSVNRTRDRTFSLSTSHSPSVSPAAHEVPTEVICHCASRVQISRSESTCSLHSTYRPDVSASRPKSCSLSTQLTRTCSLKLDASKHASESKTCSGCNATPPPSTSFKRTVNSLDKVSYCSGTSFNKNIHYSKSDEPSICSPDVSLSISQPTSRSPSNETSHISLASHSHSSNIQNAISGTLPQPKSTSVDSVITVSTRQLPSTRSPDIIISICRPSSSSDSLDAAVVVASCLDNRQVTLPPTARPSSPPIPCALPPTPLAHKFRSGAINGNFPTGAQETISTSTFSIHSHAGAACPSTCNGSDRNSPEKTTGHLTSGVRQFSSKTVTLPKNVIRPHVPYINPPTFEPISGCTASTKSNIRPLSGPAARKRISETTFVIESPNSAIRPSISRIPIPTARPMSGCTSGRDVQSPFGARKLISDATFVVHSPKSIVRPHASWDDSKQVQGSSTQRSRAPARAGSPSDKTRPDPRACASLENLPAASARRPLPAGSVPPARRKPPAAGERSRSAEVKLGRRLLKAAQAGRAPAVRKLLDEGADVNFTFATKWTALHRAVKMGHEEVVRVLLDGGADLEAKTTYDFTALHIAAYYDHRGACLARLLRAGSVLGSRNRSGKTPLHYAAEVGNAAAVRALVAAGASTASTDDDGRTPLDVAKAGDVRGLLAAACK